MLVHLEEYSRKEHLMQFTVVESVNNREMINRAGEDYAI